MLVKVNFRGPGYYADALRMPGDIFEMKEEVYKPIDPKTGKPYKRPDGTDAVCKWANPVGEEEEAPVAAEQPKRAFGAGPERGSQVDSAAPKSVKKGSKPAPDVKSSEGPAEL